MRKSDPRQVKWIYVEQYGSFWKMRVHEWAAICESCKDQLNEYDLSQFREIKRPRWIRSQTSCTRTETGVLERRGFSGHKAGCELVSPLDWEPEAYADWLANAEMVKEDV